MEVLFGLGIVLAVKVCVDAFSFVQEIGPYEEPPTPTVPELPRQDDNWYRAATERTDAEIAYLVKQEELRETHEWLARRNR